MTTAQPIAFRNPTVSYAPLTESLGQGPLSR